MKFVYNTALRPIIIQKEEEKLRMAMRVQSKTKKSTAGRGTTGRSVGGYGADAYHDDGSDDEGAISLAAIKNKYKKGMNIPVKGKLYFTYLNKINKLLKRH